MTQAFSRSPIGDAKLFVLSALLGAVTPELRGVSVMVDSEGVFARFIFDTELTDSMREIVDDAETEVIADYGGLSPVVFRPEYLPSQQVPNLGAAEHWVFLRREPPRIE